MLDKNAQQKENISNESSSVTYVDGLGFVPDNNLNINSEARKIRRMASVLTASLCFYFVFNRLLTLPITYIAYFLGLDISINYETGLILVSDTNKIILLGLISIISLLFSIFLCGGLYHTAIQSSKIFHRPRKYVTAISIPIVISVGLMSYTIAFLFFNFFSSLGIVFSAFPSSVIAPTSNTLTSFILVIFIAIFEEILFRGVLITPLRRFGDEFAIIISSILFALFADNLSIFFAYFFLGLVLGYFTIRSGSVFTAIISRITFLCVMMLLRLLPSILEHSLATVVNLLIIAIVLILAVFSFIRFARSDKNAFKLIKSDSSINLSSKIGLFCTSFIFLVFTVFIVFRIISTMQIIG